MRDWTGSYYSAVIKVSTSWCSQQLGIMQSPMGYLEHEEYTLHAGQNKGQWEVSPGGPALLARWPVGPPGNEVSTEVLGS